MLFPVSLRARPGGELNNYKCNSRTAGAQGSEESSAPLCNLKRAGSLSGIKRKSVRDICHRCHRCADATQGSVASYVATDALLRREKTLHPMANAVHM